MTTLFDATLQLGMRLGVIRSGVVDSGDTTSVIDALRTEADDTWNGGTIWITYDAGGNSAAPEGEYSIITDFANATGDITIEALTTTVAAGDYYSCASARYPLDVLKTAINNELTKHEVIRYDTTSLDVAAGQSEYDLPVGIYGHNLMGVYEATTTDSNDNKWTPLNFSVQEADTGSQHVLVIHSEITSTNDLMLEYKYRLVPLYLASDEIDTALPLEKILDAAAANCELIRMRTYGSESKLDIEMMKIYKQDAQIADMKNPIRLPARRGKINEAHT